MSKPKKEEVIPVSVKIPLSLANELAADSAWNANKSAAITTALREYVARRAASPAPTEPEPAPDDLRQLVMLLVTEVHRLAGGAVSPDLIAAAGGSVPPPDQSHPAAPPPSTGRKRTAPKAEQSQPLPFAPVIVSTGTKGDGEEMPLIEARNHYVYSLYHAGYDAAFIAAQLKAEADATGVKGWAISKATIGSMVKKVGGRQHNQPTPAAMAGYQPLTHPDVVAIARRSHVCAITLGAKGSRVSQRLTPSTEAEG